MGYPVQVAQVRWFPRSSWKCLVAVLLLAGSIESPARAASVESPSAASSAASPATGSGATAGETNAGFDVTGSHPLPNASDREPPGRGACGCTLGGDSGDRDRDASFALLALLLVVASRRR